MNLVKFKNSIKIISSLPFGIFVLGLIAITSSFGSFIEQDEAFEFYKENYNKPIYGFIDTKFILILGLDHVYTTWWFLTLLIFFGVSLLSCTVSRQFPLFKISKEFFFKQKQDSFLTLPFSIRIQNIYYLKESTLGNLQNLHFYLYQKKNFIYGYKGLIGRISPILVHFSLALILFGGSIGAFFNFKVQEVLPKGEVFHIQNPLRVGFFTSIPQINGRVNDFWVEYDQNRIHQFYSTLSILDNFGNEIKEQTISVNNPLRYKSLDFYQSDWNLAGIRFLDIQSKKIYEAPLFPLNIKEKSWITWIKEKEKITSLILDQFQEVLIVYNEKGNFLGKKNRGDFISNQFRLVEILPTTGLLIKYDPSIIIIYLGFGLLMITTFLSYFPYTQIWILNKKENCWIGSSTNRGKIQLEIEFENFLRYLENFLQKSLFYSKKNNMEF
jgi:cytochrome c biogenesis protein